MIEVTVITYLCRDCGEKDRVKYFESEHHTQPINCMSCHAKDSMYIVPEETTKYNQVEFQPEIVKGKGHAKPEHSAKT